VILPIPRRGVSDRAGGLLKTPLTIEGLRSMRRKINEKHAGKIYRLSRLGTVLDADGKYLHLTDDGMEVSRNKRWSADELDARGVNIDDCVQNGYLLRSAEESDEQVEEAAIPGNPKPAPIKMDDELTSKKVGGGPSLEEVAKSAGREVRTSIQDVDPSLLGDKTLDDLNAMAAERGHPGNFSGPDDAIAWLTSDFKG